MLPLDALREAPHSAESERAVLAGALLDPALLESALEIVTPEDFHLDPHRHLVVTACSHRCIRRDAVDLPSTSSAAPSASSTAAGDEW